ncbi:hypothetical protein AAY473_033793, partial [Plecturocebus cupreus]
MIFAHCNLRLPGSSDSPASASQTVSFHPTDWTAVAQSLPPRFRRFWSFSFLKTGFCHVGQACLKLLTSSYPPTSASQSSGITGMSYHTCSVSNSYIHGPLTLQSQPPLKTDIMRSHSVTQARVQWRDPTSLQSLPPVLKQSSHPNLLSSWNHRHAPPGLANFLFFGRDGFC